MCGIVGYIGGRPAVDLLVKGLRRLEYRGYDSAGVAFFRNNKIEILKAEGKLSNVEKLLQQGSFGMVRCGIGHTRWATHGKPTTQNAHPHQTGHVVLAHNGIIENYQQIRQELLARGHQPKSETDSELFGFLVLEEMEAGRGLVDAVRSSFARLQGACSVVVMSEMEPGVIVGVRNGSPLVAAVDPQGGALLASDAQPMLEITQDVVFLEHGDVVVATATGIEFFDLKTGDRLQRAVTRLDWSLDALDKRGFAHFMLKEIFEQPTALIDTLNALVDRGTARPFALAEQPGKALLEGAKSMTIVACGTSWHAASVGQYWLEQLAGIPVRVELASEFRYRSPVLEPGTVLVGISQSGETADTLAVIRETRSKGIPTIGITNVRGCTLSREADAVFFTAAGPEIGVAATKTFLAQLMVLLVFAGFLHKATERPEDRTLFDEVLKLPHLLSAVLEGDLQHQVHQYAAGLMRMKGFFFIGRGLSFPMALEGALKLKEIAYVHAEGYAAGELKHGPIAMLDRDMAVVVIAPPDAWRDKTVSNLQEVKARGAFVIGIGDAQDSEMREMCDHWIGLPFQGLAQHLSPFLSGPVLQLLSYEIALLHGTDVDKPRNLAKSVTVE